MSAIGDPVAVPYLLSVALSPGEGWMRGDVMIELSRYGPEAACAVPYLVLLLESPEPVLRASAAVAIGKITGNEFPDIEDWGYYMIDLDFRKNVRGEYLIVAAAQEWWKDIGQYQIWPECSAGLDGERVPLPVELTS